MILRRLKMRFFRNIAVLSGLATILSTWTAAQAAAAQTSPSQAIKMVGTPNVEAVDDNSAQIAWSTNAKSSATVHYGTSPTSLSQTAQEPWGGDTNKWTTVHRVKIQGLQPNTTYYYQVESAQAQGTGTEAKGSVMSFQTKSKESATNAWRDQQRDTAKIKVGPLVRDVKDTSADIWWMSPAAANITVKYGTSPSSLSQTAQATANGKEYSAPVSNLQPNTTYYYE